MEPFDSMPDGDRDEWIDYVANCALGEMHCREETEAEQEAINELMLDAGYDRCGRCDWWMELSECEPIDGECVCSDCWTDEERVEIQGE